MGPDPADIEAVLAANLSFYHAFGSLQIEGMDRVWDRSDRVLCIHPGWRVLAGWEQVRNSWESIFHNTSLMHFTITDAQVVVHGDCAWVSCVENITSVVDARANSFGVQATNVFVRGEDRWLMVHHHGSG